MSGVSNGNMSRKEIRTGQVLNGVAMVGGGNAMRMAIKEFKHTAKTPAGQLAQRAGVKRVAKVPVLRRLASNPKAAAMGLGGGALLLHSGELVGDAISARSLHHQYKASQGASSVNVNKSENGITKSYVSPYKRTSGRGVNIEKAYRRFDPEADRQRRLGAYSGIGIGTGIGTGMAAYQASKKSLPGLGTHIKQSLKNARKPKGPGLRKPIALGAAALGSTGLGLAAYRRGISERNQPWN